MYKQPKSRDHNAKMPHDGSDEGKAVQAFEDYKGSSREGEDRASIEKDYDESHEATGACGQIGVDGYEHSKS